MYLNVYLFNLGFLGIQMSFYVVLPLKLFNAVSGHKVGLCLKV